MASKTAHVLKEPKAPTCEIKFGEVLDDMSLLVHFWFVKKRLCSIPFNGVNSFCLFFAWFIVLSVAHFVPAMTIVMAAESST